MRWLTAVLLLLRVSVSVGAAQVPGTTPAALSAAPPRAPFLQRGDEVEKRYGVHRMELDAVFRVLHQRVEKEAADLLPNLAPPAPVPFGYQILPALLPNPRKRAHGSRIVLSPFSWSRTEGLVERDENKLDALRARLAEAARAPDNTRRREYERLIDEYRKLIAGQKLIEAQIQYNRFWQGQFALHPERYRNVKPAQAAAVERQLLKDVLSFGDEHFVPSLRARADSLSRLIEKEILKEPTPDFVAVDQPALHRWVLTVRVYTDITDSTFVERFRESVENFWQLKDREDVFTVSLDIRRLSPSELYGNGHVPEKGAHINVGDHLKRFPTDGVVLTTGGNTTYVLGRSIVVGPHAIAGAVLAHEFGHQLGFKDGYFRSYENLGSEGYEILEVILSPEDGIANPEIGWLRRAHFGAVLRERLRPVTR